MAFLNIWTIIATGHNDDFAVYLFSAEHSKKVARIEKHVSAYHSVKYISPTSFIVEQLFSRLIMTIDRRKHMDPDNFVGLP